MTLACCLFSLSRVCQFRMMESQLMAAEIGNAKPKCFHMRSVVCCTRWLQMITKMLPWYGNNYSFPMKII